MAPKVRFLKRVANKRNRDPQSAMKPTERSEKTVEELMEMMISREKGGRQPTVFILDLFANFPSIFRGTGVIVEKG